ncbi:MAG: hypothetical protein ACK4VY_11670 [Brevundimonas sp.]
MTGFQIGGIVACVVVFATAWLQGGHPERFGVMANLVGWTLSVLASALTIEGLPVGLALVDIALAGVFVRMAVKGDRWWPFAAAAFMILTVLVYVARVVTPELDDRADYAARLGLFICVVGTLLIGVVERWLAGERPISAHAVWRPRGRP